LEEVGDQIGITRERVRQLQEQALRDLRKKMAKFEKQRTIEEEVELEKQQAERAKILKDLLSKGTPKGSQAGSPN
ncbi:MAG: sigma factor-like helix-turn-helix DNA-binding protein, partial [Opitutales bacterium]|nr:sigma factor-like helix-turn-helix DNA-binding protein [Opitutales bacterium]